MPAAESFIGPMREESTRLAVQELNTPVPVDAFIKETPGPRRCPGSVGAA